MSLMGFGELSGLADARRQRVRVAVAGAADPTVLQAIADATHRGWIVPILAGRQDEIGRVADSIGLSLSAYEIVDSDEPAEAAVVAVRSGQAALLMKGQISTPSLMSAVLQPELGLRAGRTICQVALMEILASDRRFLLADTGICIAPTLAQKVDILRSLVETATSLGADRPRVAAVAASEKVVPAMPETEDAAELQRRSEAGEWPDCLVQGPLSFDLAYEADACAKKRIEGEVVGRADALLFPNLLSANLTVKAIMYTAGCRFGGVLCGAAVPVVFMSRADNVMTRMNSLAMALRMV